MIGGVPYPIMEDYLGHKYFFSFVAGSNINA